MSSPTPLAKTNPTAALVAKARAATEGKVSVGVANDAELTWQQKLIRHARTSSTFFSILVHACLMLIFSMIVVTSPMASDLFKTVLVSGENDDTQSLEMFPEAVLDLSAGSSAKSLENLPDVVTEQVMPSEQVLATQLNAEIASLFKDGVGQTDGNNGELRGLGGFAIPRSGNVVTKGSFTAWTEPEDPRPGEDYKIIILVKLPDRVNRYRLSDLTGMVIGTDRYRQSIPGPEMLRRTDYLPIKQGVAQLVVTVPGADRLVKDTIRLKSKLLNEEQELDIEF